MRGRTPWVRSASVWTGATVVAMALLGWLRPDQAVAARPGDLEQALAQGAALTAAACVVWLWCVATLAVAEAVELRSPGSTRRSPVARLVLIACGVALSGAAVVPANADPVAAGRHERSAVDALAGLPLPERPTGSDQPSGPDRNRHSHLTTETGARASITVRSGDSLWSLARQQLPPGVGDAAIDALWRRIHDANLDVIGPDPDRLRPGQRLVLPLGGTEGRQTGQVVR
jgi:nucleoid-associated protein YgaU